MKSYSRRYRLTTRDLHWGDGQVVSTEKKAATSVLNLNSLDNRYHRINQAIEQLYLPHVGELLSRISTYDLAPWQRSCAWARGWRIHESIIRFPRAIVPFLDDTNALDEATQAISASAREAKACEEELRLLGDFTGDDPHELNIATLLGRIATLSLFERSSWGRKERESIFEQVLASPEMCYYFAAATTPTPDEWISLTKPISRWPRLSFATLCLPHLPISAPLLPAREMLKNRVRKDPIFNWALKFRSHGCNLEKLTEDVIAAPYPGSVECGFALALAPSDPRVPEWLSGLEHEPQLAYEVRRILSLSNQLDSEFVLAPKLGAIAMRDPRWAFHWLRDFGEDDEETALSLFPNLEWIAELIDCGVVSVEHANVVDDTAAQSMEMDHWLRSSFLLFAANKQNRNEKN